MASIGRHRREKGKGFEQLIADAYRKAFPEATVRRSLQAHRAYEPDVVVENHPLASRFWTECQHADATQPLVKLAQAEKDISNLNRAATRILPVVVWRTSGSRTIHVTTRMWVLEELSGRPHNHMETWGALVVTMDFAAWLKALM